MSRLLASALLACGLVACTPTPTRACPIRPGSAYSHGVWTDHGRPYAIAPTEDSDPTCL